MSSGDKYMRRCIELATLGAGFVAPNPMVGSVLVYEDRIVGEGYHQLYGRSHAEVNCISDAAVKHLASANNSEAGFDAMLQKSTIYVSLEPCAHFGKTPPCADLIIAKKIPQVVIGCRDPFKEVDGKGIDKLLAAGINVSVGIMEEACRELNKRFFTFHTLKRPYIILKWAQSADRKISANGSRVYITKDITNRVVHKWRSEEAAIMVGTNTALIDDPSLTNRLWSGNNPVRILLDMDLRLPTTLKIFDGSVKTIVFNSLKHDESGELEYYKISKGENLVSEICYALYQRDIQSVLIEGGSRLAQTFIDAGAWDEARVITNEDLFITNGTAAPVFKTNTIINTEKILSDTIQYSRP